METQQTYYARRAVAERAAAERASDVRARHAHLDLAERFDLLAAAIGDVDCMVVSDEPAADRRFGPGLIQF